MLGIKRVTIKTLAITGEQAIIITKFSTLLSENDV